MLTIEREPPPDPIPAVVRSLRSLRIRAFARKVATEFASGITRDSDRANDGSWELTSMPFRFRVQYRQEDEQEYGFSEYHRWLDDQNVESVESRRG